MQHSRLYENFHKNTKIQKKVIKRRNFTYQHIFYFLFKYLKKNDRILDIGCGAGTIGIFLATHEYTVKGIDISQSAIHTANESAQYLHLQNVQFEVNKFPYDDIDGKYDFIICSEVLEHLKEEKKALEKIYTLLRKNGTLLITVPSLNAPLYRLGYATSFDKRVGHLRRYTQESLEKLLIESKFTIIEKAKNEGIIRNFLFLNPVAGKFVRFIKFSLVDIVTYVDYLSFKLFGESNIIIVARKT